MNMNLSFAMQQFIMLMHIQMQQIIHELAPPTCVFNFNLSPPYYIFLPLCDFSIFVTFLSLFVNNHQKGANFSESQVNQYEGVQIMVQSRSLA
jgi:hypothetical protein